jgi:alpha-ribazole phosphatase/probable phosphoglycerate mutase
VVGFEAPAYNGHTDVALTELGRAQLDAAAEDLRETRIDTVYASDLARARYGGERLAVVKGLPLNLAPEFREIHFGSWEGMSFEEIERRWPGELTRRFQNMAHHQIPEGETIVGLWTRIQSAMENLLARHKGQAIALVAHSGVNRAILLQALGCGPEMIWRMDQDYGCLNIVDYFHDGRTLIRLANGPNRATVAARATLEAHS